MRRLTAAVLVCFAGAAAPAVAAEAHAMLTVSVVLQRTLRADEVMQHCAAGTALRMPEVSVACPTAQLRRAAGAHRDGGDSGNEERRTALRPEIVVTY